MEPSSPPASPRRGGRAEAPAADQVLLTEPTLLQRIIKEASRRENAEYLAGLAVLFVVLVAVLLELTDGEATPSAGWSLTKAASSAGMSLLSSRAVAAAPAVLEACTCQHAEAGLAAALASCGKCAGSSAELVQALTVQTAAQAEALSALEERLHVAEEARDDALRKAAATAAELEEKSLCSDAPGARTRAYDAMQAAKERAREAEAAAEAANAAAEDAVRKQQRLAAKVAVAEAELGLLTAEKALLQTKLTVAEETAIAAAAACGGALPERAEALRRGAAEDARKAAAAVERARAVVTESVHRADAAFSATAPRTAHSKDRAWHSRLELSFGDAADTGGGAALRAVTRGPIRRRRKSLGSQLGALLLWLLWRLRFLFLLAAVAAGYIHVQTGTEEAAEVADDAAAWRREKSAQAGAQAGAQAAGAGAAPRAGPGRVTPDVPLSSHPGGGYR